MTGESRKPLAASVFNDAFPAARGACVHGVSGCLSDGPLRGGTEEGSVLVH